MFWKKWLPCDGVTWRSLKPASTMARAPEIWSQVTGIPSQGSARSPPPHADEEVGDALGPERGVELRDLLGGVGAPPAVEAIGVDDDEVAYGVDAPVPEDVGAAAEQPAPAPRPRAPAPLPPATAPAAASGGRRTASGRRGGRWRFTANSISTGAFIPHSPISMRALMISARGNVSCLRIGAKLTTRAPGRERPVVDRVVLARVGGARPRGACRRPRPPPGRSAPRPPLAVGPVAGREAQGPELPLRVPEDVGDGGELEQVVRVARAEAEARAALHDGLARGPAPPPRSRPAPSGAPSGRSCGSAPRPRSRDRSGRRGPRPRPAGGRSPSSLPRGGRASRAGRPWRCCENVEA